MEIGIVQQFVAMDTALCTILVPLFVFKCDTNSLYIEQQNNSKTKDYCNKKKLTSKTIQLVLVADGLLERPRMHQTFRLRHPLTAKGSRADGQLKNRTKSVP